MIRYEAQTLAQSVRLARFVHDEESRDETAAGASRFMDKPISRGYIARIEEPHKRSGLTEDSVDPLVVRALAAHFDVDIADLSPKVAERLAKRGIPPISRELVESTSLIEGYRRRITEHEATQLRFRFAASSASVGTRSNTVSGKGEVDLLASVA